MSLRDLNYFIKPGYQARTQVSYYVTGYDEQKRHQPHAYGLVAFLARRFGCTTIIDLGCGTAEKLAPLSSEFAIIGVDIGSNLAVCRANYQWGSWIEADLDQPHKLPIESHILEKSLVICADVIEHLVYPEFLLNTLHDLLNYCPVAILTTPARDRVRGISDLGPPANPFHVREWDLSELVNLLQVAHFRVEHAGYTINNNLDREKKTSLAVLANHHQPEIIPAPLHFRVMAIIAVYNEADVLAATIEHYRQQQVDVYVIDNWSVDGSYEIAHELLGKGVSGLERYPLKLPPDYVYDWSHLLERKAELSRILDADWFIHNDADELRISPWAGVNLRDAFYHVQRRGFNAVDFTVVNFQPTGDAYIPGTSLDYFRYYEFGKRPGHFQQVKAWYRADDIDVASSAGHDVAFSGRRVFPYKFTLRHYTFRSTVQATAKLKERLVRTEAKRQRSGWHTHLLEYTPDHQFVRDPDALHLYAPDDFMRDMLIERLSGIGILSD